MPIISGPREPAVKVIKSTFGGGWVFPLNDDGLRVLTEYFGEGPTSFLNFGEHGWIVEPQDAGDLADYLRAENVAWKVEN